MKKLTKFLGALLLSTGAFLALSAGIVFAAAPTGVLTAGPVSVVTSYEATDAGMFSIVDTNGEIKATKGIWIRIPSTVDAAWDTTASISIMPIGTPTCTISNIVNYYDATGGTTTARKVAKFTVTGDCTAADHIIIAGMKIKGGARSTGATLEWKIDNATYEADTGWGNSSGTVTIAPATTTDAAITIASPQAGATGASSLAVSLPTHLNLGDTIKVTFPNNYDISTLNGTATTGTVTTVGVSGQVATLTIGAGGLDPTGSPITFNFAATSNHKITARYVATGTASILIQRAAGTDIVASATDTGNPITGITATASTVGALTVASVTPNTLATNSVGYHTVTFTTHAAIPNLGKIVVAYPSGWITTYSNGHEATNLSGLNGTWTASVSGQNVTFTQTGGTQTVAGTYSFRSPSIGEPSAAGSGGVATITTTTAADANIETLGSLDLGTIFAPSSATGYTTGLAVTTPPATSTPPATTTPPTTPATPATPATPPASTLIPLETGGTTTFSDVEASWAKTEITAMTAKGIVKGNADGTFKPEDNLNRADSAILICRVLKMDEKKAIDADPFADAKKDTYYGSCVAQLKAAKVVNGNANGTYTPVNNINRAEFIALALRAYGSSLKDQAKTDFDASMNATTPKASFSDVNAKTDWYANVASTAKDKSFVGGRTCGADKCFDGTKSITRAEATTVLYRIFKDLL